VLLCLLPQVEAGTPVAIYAEDKEHAMAVGLTSLGTLSACKVSAHTLHIVLLCLLLQVEAGTPVAIYAEDKEHAMAVGLTTLSTQEMREVNKGIGVELMHHLNDALWKTTTMH
jgi:predicted ribosome-associated RNA-binding protein Tma20